MNILVTGACGYIGSHFVKYFLRNNRIDNCSVYAIDNLSTGNKKSIPSSVELLVEDLCNVEKVEKYILEKKIDAIFHFAGKIIVSESVENPYLYYKENTYNTLNLANIAARSGVKYFIFSSTAAVYGQPKEGVLITEDIDTNPISPYGKSKLFSENMIKDICNISSMKYAILRYFNVAGASSDLSIGSFNENSTHLIKICCNVALGKKESVGIFGNDYPTFDGTGIRDYIHIEDLVSAHSEVLNFLMKHNKSETFNIGYGKGFSVLQVIEAFNDVLNRQIPYSFERRRDGDCASVVASVDKIKMSTDWKPQFEDIKKIVESAYKWEEKTFPKSSQ